MQQSLLAHLKKFRTAQLLVFFLMIAGSGCGDATSTDSLGATVLTVRVIGVYQGSEENTGSAEPYWIQMNLQDVIVTELDAETSTSLYEAEEETTIKAINRSQIVFQYDMADYLDVTFSDFSLVFNPVLTVSGEINEAEISMENEGLLTLIEDYTVETAKPLNFTLKLQWKNTVEETEDSLTAELPGFLLEKVE